MESLIYWFNRLTTPYNKKNYYINIDESFGNLPPLCVEKENDEICVCDECSPWFHYDTHISDEETRNNTWECRNPDCDASFTSVAKRHIRECRHCKMFQIVGM
jgi:hypothetical protein